MVNLLHAMHCKMLIQNLACCGIRVYAVENVILYVAM
jgi:hypothetical protein